MRTPCPAIHPDDGYRCVHAKGHPNGEDWHEATDGLVTVQWEVEACSTCWFDHRGAKLIRTVHADPEPCPSCLWAYGPEVPA